MDKGGTQINVPKGPVSSNREITFIHNESRKGVLPSAIQRLEICTKKSKERPITTASNSNGNHKDKQKNNKN